MFTEETIIAFPIHSGDNEVTKAIKTQFMTLYDAVLKTAIPSRERSLALTNLEQSAMWAVKAIHMNKGKQK